jgi:hypothetical protein
VDMWANAVKSSNCVNVTLFGNPFELNLRFKHRRLSFQTALKSVLTGCV